MSLRNYQLRITVLLQQPRVVFAGFALIILFSMCAPVLPQGNVPDGGNPNQMPSSKNADASKQTRDQAAPQKGDVEQLRDEVKTLRSELERLRALVETKGNEQPGASSQPSPTEVGPVGTPQSTSAAPDNPARRTHRKFLQRHYNRGLEVDVAKRRL